MTAGIGVVDQAESELIARAITGFGLSAPLEGRRVAGLMNRSWRVRTSEGVWALKLVLDIDTGTARQRTRLSVVLAEAGIPVPVAHVTPAGDRLVDLGSDGAFVLLPWVSGSHLDGADLTFDECHRLGALLAGIHQVTRTSPVTDVLGPAPGTWRPRVADPAVAAARIDRFARMVTQRSTPDEFDELVRRRLVERRALLDRVADDRPAPTGPATPVGWIHGDFHEDNVLWSTGPSGRRDVRAVLDWDRVRQGSFAAELVRAATLIFAQDSGGARVVDVPRVAAFTRGYRSVVGLSEGQVLDAEHRLWWDRVCDVWQVAWHYERDDTSCDHLFASSSALVEWWSDHRDTVRAALTGTATA